MLLLSEGKLRERRAQRAHPCERPVQYATRSGWSRETGESVKDVSKPGDVALRAERPVKGYLIEYHVALLTLSNQRITEWCLSIPGFHRGGLHERVRVLPRQAARHELKQDR